HFQRAAAVGLYLSTDNEVDPTALLLAATLSEKAVFLPVVHRPSRTLQFVRYRDHDPLVVGSFGIREPLLRPPVAPEEVASSPLTGPDQVREVCPVTDLDVLYLPLVAFDRQGWRLGYGGGYYDRCLARAPGAADRSPLLVGLAYHFQEVPALPHGAHDMPMDRVITERVCLTCSGTGARAHTYR
ncbi:MAG: 5-formyltetrahydrofolate cyclo-ligase, partial [Magnetococcus sp. DMHC-8]